MTISGNLQCPNCKFNLIVAGKSKVHCPHCDAEYEVPPLKELKAPRERRVQNASRYVTKP